MLVLDDNHVRTHLKYDYCIKIVRQAMSEFSAGKTRQLLRSVLPLSEGRVLGVMPGAMGEQAVFGAKVISVFNENLAKGKSSHQGLVILFDPDDGAPVCAIDASAITAIRTAAASAAATDALARTDATRLALLGYGEQAHAHAHALSNVRPIGSISLWGRRFAAAEKLAARLSRELGVEARPASSVAEAVSRADIVCTVTAAREPILEGRWIVPGTHLNVVGSSGLGPREIDDDLVVRSRFIVDSRPSVIAQGAEFAHAKEAGLIDDTHIVAEIGEVFTGSAVGRLSPEDVTVYKSLGHVVQDLASAWALYCSARRR